MSPTTSPVTDGLEVLALSCHEDRCPTLYRDPASGKVGVRGYVSTADGERVETISWMEPGQWDLLRGAAPSEV